MTKTSIERIENMFKNIDLDKLSLSELRLLLKCTDLYASEFNNEVISEKLKSQLNEYGDLICKHIEEKETDKYADELEKEYIQQENELAKMYALNDIERDTQ